MDTRSIAAVLLKIAGLLLLGACVTQLPNYFPTQLRPGEQWSAVSVMISAFMNLGPALLLGLFLWFFPGKIANKVVVHDPNVSAHFDFHGLLLVAIVILGLFLIARGTVDVVYHVVTIVAWHRVNDASLTLPPTTLGNIVANVVELGIGLVLCLGRQGVARLVERARGQERPRS